MTVHIPLSMVDRRPLDDHERELIRLASWLLWTPELRAMLTDAVQRRGVRVGTFDTCGDLADALLMLGNAS